MDKDCNVGPCIQVNNRMTNKHGLCGGEITGNDNTMNGGMGSVVVVVVLL
jgi:hypothetical protein